jgi:tetratricopeptide (TPR) repeat protein
MKGQLVTRLLRMNVHMGRVAEGPQDARVLDLAQLADALDRKGETEEALAFSREAVSLLPRVWELLAQMPPRKRRKYAAELAAALKRLTVRLRAGGELDEAMIAGFHLVAISAELADPDKRHVMGGKCWELAEEQLAIGRNEHAIAVSQLAVTVWKQIDGSDGVLGVGCSFNLLSRSLGAAGRWEEALAAAEEAVAIFRENGGGSDLDEALSLRSAALAAM